MKEIDTSEMEGRTSTMSWRYLEEFYFITMRMEGDHSLACVLLSEYQYIIDFLKKQMQAPNDCNFAPMMRKMISKAKGYLDEALKCDAVILATIFNPAFRLSIFKIWFPTYHDYAESLLQEQYNKLKSEFHNGKYKVPYTKSDISLDWWQIPATQTLDLAPKGSKSSFKSKEFGIFTNRGRPN
ncbi:hypothetical protein PCASD_04854 [Puccinia coronata f. sp. avenae]|uniref:hAT-like transposase RNase-H fold domain-containing protein n=1 Tax=Puccinia coronata f. sp. avenae TaxID=200324 RepID=A0A2N5V2D1_9BASI|nr:hypothetical protein PCASD_04854 [Puccinia coronata f. sp. avenae]